MENYTFEQSPKPEEIIENFYKKISLSCDEEVKRFSLEHLRELKESGITLEKFLDYLCQEKGFLLHGSMYEIATGRLQSKQKKIFASNKSSIAIMRSLYSNINVNLEYPYFFDKNNTLILKVHTPPSGQFISKENGYIYIVNDDGFQNEPKGSWQFLREVDEVQFDMVFETGKTDFTYPVELYNDLELNT